MNEYPRGQSRAVHTRQASAATNHPARSGPLSAAASPASISSRPLDFQRFYLERLGRQAFAVTVCDEDSRGAPVARNFRIISAVLVVAKRSPRRGTAVNFTPQAWLGG
jgi:hypothetical protein